MRRREKEVEREGGDGGEGRGHDASATRWYKGGYAAKSPQ